MEEAALRHATTVISVLLDRVFMIIDGLLIEIVEFLRLWDDDLAVG